MKINMDPWFCQSQTEISIPENTITKFEDNFLPELSNKLPDSEQYLAALEEKLRRIKNDPNIIAQLTAKKEACMQELLAGISQVDEESIHLDEPVFNSQLLRTIAPQKQALSQGEIVELIKYDQLKEENDLEVGKDSVHNNKYRLPLLITVGFMVLDIRMQLDINVQTRRVPRPRPPPPPRMMNADEMENISEDASDDSWSTIDENFVSETEM